MPTVNEYTSQLIVPQYNPQSYDINLEVAVAQKNQQNYNRVLNSVRNLQSQALNIQMLNQEGKQRLDEYNKELNENLSGDLGDLNKVEVQNQVASYFQKVAGDTQLIKASQLSGQYQNQLDMIESFRQSGRKDKGYNSINETVFKEWDGGLYDFAQSSLGEVTSPGFQPIGYTPFKELDTKMLNIAKTLHADTIIKEGASGSEGYLLHQERSGVSPEKIREMMLSTFDQEDLEQLDVMAKYEVIQNRKLNSIPQFYDKYNSFADNEIRRVESLSDASKQQADYYTNLIKDKNTPADKKAEYAQIVTQLQTNSGLYSDRATSLRNSKKTYSDFEKMSNNELLEYAKEIQWNNKINGLSDALSRKKEVDTLKPDQVWMFNKKMDVMKWQEEMRAQTKMNVARLQREGKGVEAPQFSGPIDSVRNTQNFFDSYKTLTAMQESYAKMSNRVITSPSFNKSQLLDNNFLQQNKDNYEVKMWDVYRREYPDAVKGGQPQVEAFKLWLADKEANPSGITGQYVEQQNKNEIVSDWLDTKTMEINQATRSKVSVYDALEGYPMYKADGSPLSKEEYNSGVQGFLGVPTSPDKTDFRLIPIEDVMNEAEIFSNKEKEYLQNQGSSFGGGMLGAGTIGTRTPKPTSYIANDRGLYQRILKANELKNQYNKQLERELIGRLPQIFQMPLVEAVNDEAKLIYLPDVVSAAKNSNEGKDMGQFAISIADIEFIRPPTTGEFGQIGLKPDRAKTLGELGWRLPDAADPTKTVLIQPGVSYAFRTNKPYMPYDVILNEAVKDNPIKDKYKGYTTTVSRSKLDGSFTVGITDSKGITVVNPITTNQITDVNKAIEAAHRQIEVEIFNQTKK